MKQENLTIFDQLDIYISILTTLSKILKRICINQITLYVNNNIMPASQSGFRQSFSVDTCLLNMVDNMLQDFEVSKNTVIV